jgi:hypothetical protein
MPSVLYIMRSKKFPSIVFEWRLHRLLRSESSPCMGCRESVEHGEIHARMHGATPSSVSGAWHLECLQLAIERGNWQDSTFERVNQ